MVLDHFRPRSIPEYKHLTNDPSNLHYSCYACNDFKGSEWPAYGNKETYVGDAGFVDPFEEDRREFFDIIQNCKIVALKDPASYMIHILHLNRSFLREMRQVRDLLCETGPKILSYIDADIGGLETLIGDSRLKSSEKIGYASKLQDVKDLRGKVETLINSLEHGKH